MICQIRISVRSKILCLCRFYIGEENTSKIERGKIRAIWWLIAYISHFIFKPLMLLINNCPRHLSGHLSSVLHWIFSCLHTKFNEDPVISIVINVFDLIFKRLSSIFDIRMVRIIFFQLKLS